MFSFGMASLWLAVDWHDKHGSGFGIAGVCGRTVNLAAEKQMGSTSIELQR